jgi:hypothetical protein
LTPLELQPAAGVVASGGREWGAGLPPRPSPPSPLLPGDRVRVRDGNPGAGTEQGGKELRRSRAAARPGHALVFYDPQGAGATDGIPGEAAYAQARPLLPEVVPMGAKGDGMGADRNFCTLGGLFGVARQGAGFVIRHPGANGGGPPPGPRRGVGPDARGQALYEQARWLTEPAPGATLVVRRITGQWLTPTRQGEPARHLLPHLPVPDAPAPLSSALDADRWPLETALQPLPVDLAWEVATLGYPKAALVGFCRALVAYKVGALVKGARRAAPGAEDVEEHLSRYYLPLEVAPVPTGLALAGEEESGESFRQLRRAEFTPPLAALALPLDRKKYPTHTRGPTKKPPPHLSGKQAPQVSPARILALRGSSTDLYRDANRGSASHRR